MKVFVFLASGILEDGSVAFFSYEFIFFLEQDCFFNESVVFFGFRHFGRRFGGPFSYEFIRFFETELFLNQSVSFFGFRHFGRWVMWPFSYEFISFFETELFFSMGMLVFLASSILENGSVAFFHVNLFFLKHLASGILVGTFLCFSYELKNLFNSIVFQ